MYSRRLEYTLTVYRHTPTIALLTQLCLKDFKRLELLAEREHLNVEKCPAEAWNSVKDMWPEL